MPRALRRSAPFALVFACWMLGGCQWTVVHLRIVDFDSAQVAGVRLWRETEEPDLYEPDGDLVFDALEIDAEGFEVLTCIFDSATGGESGWRIQADVERVDAGVVEVSFHYPRTSGPGRFKATTWNAAGESALSDDSTLL